MKRNNSESQLLYYYNNTTPTATANPTANPIVTTLSLSTSSPTTNTIVKKFKTREFINKPPSNYISLNNASIIPINILQLLNSINPMNDDSTSSSSSSSSCYFKFIFFLGAQGKEFIPTIQYQFPFNISVTFITSNNDSSSGGSGGGCTNDQCKQLMKFFEIKDPMGAGLYPLDYLIIIHQNKVHCKIPIKFNNNSTYTKHFKVVGGMSGHLKFGIDLNELPSLIEEYINYQP
ncbi:hypothetical protein MGS_05333 [Candida albicans P78042]|nr:hypothetical protein MGK_05314 [Candida albicans P57055]KHC67951.1 hypothetical protein MGS_05333 [Candida albicans P78042]